MKTLYQLKFLLFYFALCQKFQVNDAQIIFLYEHANKDGAHLRIRVDQCYNLPDNWVRKPSSIDTLDNCARLFSGKDCAGEFIEIMPNSPGKMELNEWRFGDMARSAGPCPNACSTDVTGILPLSSFQIQIYSRENFEGTLRTVSVKGCTLIPEDFKEKIGSVNTAYCIQFYDNKECETESKPFDSKSVELRRGTPHHDHFDKWNFPNSKAVSHCAYKCNPIINVESTTPTFETTTLQKIATLPKINQTEVLNTTALPRSSVKKETEDMQSRPHVLANYWPFAFLIPVLVGFVIFVVVAIVVIVRQIPRGTNGRIYSEVEMRENCNRPGMGFGGANETVAGSSAVRPNFKINNTLTVAGMESNEEK